MASRKDKYGKALQKCEYQRKDGRYVYAYTNEEHKRVYVYADTLEGLRKKERAILMSSWNGIEKLGEKVTLNILYERAMKLKIGIKKSTYASYRQMYDNHVRDGFGKRDIQEIRYSDVIAFYNQLLREKNLGIKSVQHIHAQINSAFQLAVQDGLILRNPAEGSYGYIKRSGGLHERKIRALTLDEQREFIEFINEHPIWGRYHSIFAVMLGTGLRVGELCGLRWEDIDLDNRTIRIDHTLVHVKPIKGEAKEVVTISTPKTKCGVRNVPMMLPVVAAFMEEYKIAKAKKFKTVTVDGYNDFIFTQENGNVYSSIRLDLALKKIVEAYNSQEEQIAAVENRRPHYLPHISNHMLRHTFCTRLCERDVNIKVIQTVMGHASINITLDIYAEVSREKQIKEIDKLAAEIDVF